MTKRLLKAMPHVPLLELRPELRQHNEANGENDNPQDTVDGVEMNTQGSDEANPGGMEANDNEGDEILLI